MRHHARAMLERHNGESLPAQAADRELARLIDDCSLPMVPKRALTGFFRAEWDGAEKLGEKIAAWWIEGEAMRAPLLLERPSDGRMLLASLTRVLRALDYRGLLVTVDEAEKTIKLPPRKRAAAWENLRAQIDSSGAPGLLVVLAVTLAALDAPEGPEENPALRSRLSVARKAATDSEKPFDPNSTILALDKLKFNADNLRSVACQIRTIFEVAEGVDNTHLSDGEIDDLVRSVVEEAGRSETARCRALVQVVVQALYERIEDPGRPLGGLLDGLQDAIRDAIRRPKGA
jgi:hypothetical protein